LAFVLSIKQHSQRKKKGMVTAMTQALKWSLCHFQWWDLWF